MRRWRAGVLWLGSGFILGAAGCSGESVPPVVAFSPAGDERPKPRGALPGTTAPAAPEAQSRGLPSPAARATRDAGSATGAEVEAGQSTAGTLDVRGSCGEQVRESACG